MCGKRQKIYIRNGKMWRAALYDIKCSKNLHKSVSSISTTRAQLISKGIIYPVRYKELDFTVPEFSGFIQRLDEYKQWDEN